MNADETQCRIDGIILIVMIISANFPLSLPLSISRIQIQIKNLKYRNFFSHFVENL